jgi:MFS family permease
MVRNKMIANYWTLLRAHRYFFLFSLSGPFFSAPGQTLLMALAIPLFCQQTGISELQFATLYAAATVLSASTLPIVGRIIDTKPVLQCIQLNTIGLSSALALMAYSTHMYGLFMGLFLARLFGQGALPLTAIAHTAKTFSNQKGRALSITQLGYPLSECVLPSIVLMGLHTIGIRYTYFILIGAIIGLYYPLSRIGAATIPHPQQVAASSQPTPQWRTILRDPFFIGYALLSTIPPMIMTAALYFQTALFTNNQWPLLSLPRVIAGYAIAKSIATFCIGPLLDRIGVMIPLTAITLCMGIAPGIAALSGSVHIPIIYYILFGIGIGASGPTITYLWHTLYGSTHIGEVKGIVAILRNGSTALTPVLFSLLYTTYTIPLSTLFAVSSIVILILGMASPLLYLWDKRLRITNR